MAKQYVNGIYFNPRGDKSPDWVTSRVKVDLKQFSDFVKHCKENGWTENDKKGDPCIFFDLSPKSSGDGFSAQMYKKDDQGDQF